jgi:hypothetical protein
MRAAPGLSLAMGVGGRMAHGSLGPKHNNAVRVLHFEL